MAIYGPNAQRIRDYAQQQPKQQQQQQQQPAAADPNAPAWQARDNGITWNPGAAETVQGRTSIDPNTGSLVGPDSLIPHQLGLQYQAEHDRRIFDYRQRLMQDASSYGRGALGLMQSFRPGGGATLEAGQYNNLAQIQLNRAQLTTPMDLLGDYRRHEGAVSRQKANRAAERQMAVQIGVALAGVAAAGLTGGALAPAAIGAVGAIGSSAYRGGQGSQTDSNMAAQTGQQTQELINQQGGGQMGAAPPGGNGFVQGPAIEQGAIGAPFPQIGPPAEAMGGGGGQAIQAPGQAPQGGQQPGGGKKKVGGPMGQGGQQQGGMGASGGMGGPGADGIFTPTAYATYGAAQQNPVQRAVLSSQLAQQLDDDPFYDTFTFAVNARFAQRMAQA